MADDITNGADGTNVSEPEVVELELDGRKVSVPKTAAEILKQKEHDLASRNERILAEERERIRTESSQRSELLKRDMENLDKLLAQGVTELSLYDPLINGGTGQYRGKLPDTDDLDDQPKRRTKNDSAFAETEYDKIRNELAELRKTLTTKEEAEAREAVSFMEETLKSRYQYADADAVLSDMRNYHRENGRPPSEKKIVEMLKRRHDKVASIVSQTGGKPVDKANTQTMPDTKGNRSTRATAPDKLPRLDDFEAWAQLGRDELRGPA